MSNLPVDKRSNPESRFESLYDEIRERICLLQYPPGMALREETLAEEFGVSRTPIRQVLLRLEFEELVVHTKGAGVIVTTIDFKLLREVYRLRLKIAEFAGEMMVSKVPDVVMETLEIIRNKCELMRDQHDALELGKLYHSFHNAMTRLINNRPLQRIQDQLFHQTSRVWLDILPDLDWHEEVDIFCKEITDVIAALQNNDMQKVGAIRRDHMSMLLQRLNQYLSSADTD